MATRRNNVTEIKRVNNDSLTIVDDDRLQLIEAENKVNLLRKKAQLKEVCDLTKIKYREQTKQYYIYVKRVQYTGHTEKELIEKLYNLYFGLHTKSMQDLFPDYMIYRRDETKTSPKTLKEHKSIWDNHFEGTDIAKKPIKDLTASDFTDFFQAVVKSKKLSEHRYKDIKAVPACILDYAIQKGIIEHNPTQYIDTIKFQFKSQSKAIRRKDDKIISQSERTAIIEHLNQCNEKDIYDIAIGFAFRNTLRVGELKAIKWTDIDFNKRVVYIHTQVVEEQHMNDDLTFEARRAVEVDHIKGGKEMGLRTLPLSSSSIKLLQEAKQICSDSEYVFTYNGRTLTTITFNRRLKKHCDELGISDKSSHDIRFSSASTLYYFDDKKDITRVQKALGHTTVAMTAHYLKPILDKEERENVYRAALG